VGSDRFAAALLGLTPQASCCRLLRRLKAKVLKHKISNNLVSRVFSNFSEDVQQIQLAFEANKDELKTMLALVLDISKNEVKFSFEFELRMRFKGGELIKD